MPLGTVENPMKKRVMVSMTKEMYDALEEERRRRKLAAIPEVVREIVGQYFARLNQTKSTETRLNR